MEKSVSGYLPFIADVCWQGENCCKKEERAGSGLLVSAQKHQVQSFSIAPWERPEFASVQSKVPFAWHFLDNRSLINHWPWIRIFKGTTGAKTSGGACIRAWIVCVLVTQGACVSAGRTLSKLINTLVSMDVQGVYTHTHIRGRIPHENADLFWDKYFLIWAFYWRRSNSAEGLNNVCSVLSGDSLVQLQLQ